jgi:Protein of unknown function (DUF2785)
MTFARDAATAEQLPQELAALVNDLRSPDPAVRDDRAYTVLAERIGSGREDAYLAALGDAGAALLGAPEIQARSFGALLLAAVVERVNLLSTSSPEHSENPTTVRALDVVRWLALFVTWYPAEADLRGYDEQLGWLHAVAHGADALGVFGGSPLLGPADLVMLLDVAIERLREPTWQHLTQQEDDRLALAVMSILVRDRIPAQDVHAWLDRLAATWRAASKGPRSAQVDNTTRFARALQLQLTLGVRIVRDGDLCRPAARDDLVRHLSGALADGIWFLGTPP